MLQVPSSRFSILLCMHGWMANVCVCSYKEEEEANKVSLS
uniref:Uncharacterized protein n=1 Tax=Setaria viridis TaxID=4556 RepID=A0A4U6T056_SETVI|nr:hypothetical protein SEVIR_9G004650v2 [Setaria viridis]